MGKWWENDREKDGEWMEHIGDQTSLQRCEMKSVESIIFCKNTCFSILQGILIYSMLYHGTLSLSLSLFWHTFHDLTILVYVILVLLDHKTVFCHCHFFFRTTDDDHRTFIDLRLPLLHRLIILDWDPGPS